jgi:hypothetical protein
LFLQKIFLAFFLQFSSQDSICFDRDVKATEVAETKEKSDLLAQLTMEDKTTQPDDQTERKKSILLEVELVSSSRPSTGTTSFFAGTTNPVHHVCDAKVSY